MSFLIFNLLDLFGRLSLSDGHRNTEISILNKQTFSVKIFLESSIPLRNKSFCVNFTYIDNVYSYTYCISGWL